MKNYTYDSKKVQAYVEDLKKNYKKTYGMNLPECTHTTKAVMSLFDKNCDGFISKRELDAIPNDKYQIFTKGLNKCNMVRGSKDRAPEYETLQKYIDDTVISMEEINGDAPRYNIKKLHIEEKKDLKDVKLMNKKELVEELAQYGIEDSESSFLYDLQKKTWEARNERALFDQNSDVLDGHIGTYFQGMNSMCSLLATLDKIPDDKVKEMYKEKRDENGKVYYEVTFPADANTGKKVKISKEEIDGGFASLVENGKNIELTNLPRGDKDVTLFCIAYLKRYGSNIYFEGEWHNDVQNAFLAPEETRFEKSYNFTQKDLENLPKNCTISIIPYEGLKEKNHELLSKKYTFEDGRNAKKYFSYIKISDGATIDANHTYSVRGYDSKTKEFIISGQERTNLSEIRVPAALSELFSVSKQPDNK